MKIIKNWKVLWVIIVILILAIAVLSFSLFKTRMAAIDDFESCVTAGYPILEIHPGQCITPDRRMFIQDISDGNMTACTMEAKECPDGSYVGRTGPNCEFSPCP